MASRGADRSIVFTDGASKGNPGAGGWGAITITPDDMVTEIGGASPHTTNNKMELSGAIAALEAIADVAGPVTIYTDSTYLIQGITQWVWAWRKRGWRTATGGDVLNRDLWERLSALPWEQPSGQRWAPASAPRLVRSSARLWAPKSARRSAPASRARQPSSGSVSD